MAAFVVLTPEEWELERAADELLKGLPRDGERPAYTERQLARHGRRLLNIETLSRAMAAPGLSFRDEMRFLADVSSLDPDSRCYLTLWMDGWTQAEIAHAFHITQQAVSQRIRKALVICWDSAPLSFRRFSYHTLYPRRRSSRPLFVKLIT